MCVLILCDSLQLATWVDSSVRGMAHQLELKAQTYAELAGEVVSQLHVSEIVSAVVTETHKIYWWYVCVCVHGCMCVCECVHVRACTWMRV